MKLKKVNKTFAMYNFWRYVNSSTQHIEYNIFSKIRRVQSIKVIPCKYSKWLIYKNLELNCASPHIAFAII